MSRKIFFLFSLLSYQNTAIAVSGEFNRCPDHVKVRVENIKPYSGPLTLLDKVQVEFSVEEQFSGQVDEQFEISVLKNGPIDFKKGESYILRMREYLLCVADHA